MSNNAEFIKNLDLAQDPAIGGQANSFSALIGGSSSVSFVGDLPAINQSDVMYSTLFAQLAANNECDPLKETQKWYDFYTGVLSKLAWTTTDIKLIQLKLTGQNLSVSTIIINSVPPSITGKGLASVVAMIAALKSSKNANAYHLFNRETVVSNRASFQIGACEMSGDNPVLSLFANQYSVSLDTKIEDVLFTKLSSDSVQFFAGATSMSLDTQQYASTYRDVVMQKLGQSGKDLITSIVI